MSNEKLKDVLKDGGEAIASDDRKDGAEDIVLNPVDLERVVGGTGCYTYSTGER